MSKTATPSQTWTSFYTKRQAEAWYKNIIRNFVTNPKAIVKNGIGTIDKFPTIGRLEMYWYDPKWKKKLPYYDTFPLVVPIEHYMDGWLGLNLHYLAPPVRSIFFDQLLSVASDKKVNAQTSIMVNYDLLKNIGRFAAFKPCIKRYLASHVRSPILNLDPREWRTVVPLPLQKFVKGRPW